MDLIEGMMTQKSIRRYTDEPVTQDEILQCLRAAIQAPNGGNSQPWQWLVVTDAEKRRRIGEIYKRAWDRYWPAITRDAECCRTPKRSASGACERRVRPSTCPNTWARRRPWSCCSATPSTRPSS